MPTCQNCQQKFNITKEDREFYKKIDVPEPTFCPDCRAQRRFVFYNEGKIYKRKCDFSGQDIFSVYSPEAPVKVYDHDVWWSDKWEPMEYAKDYDFSKPFFKQFKELIKEVPFFSRSILSMINSDYCANAGYLKKCYLIFEAGFSEDCAYGTNIEYSKDSYDNDYLDKCELCYQGFMLTNCYKTFFSSHCEDCQEVLFSTNCVGCSNCFGCANLRHKKYHIFNKPYSKEEYFKKLEEFNIGSFQSVQVIKPKTKKFYLKFPVKFIHGRKNVDVTGEYIYNSKNVLDSYMARNVEDSRFCQFVRYRPGIQGCYDYSSYGLNAKLVYEAVQTGEGLNKLKFCFLCYPNCRNLEYTMLCHSSADLFGCLGLRHKQYCILNKQYSKQEYEQMVAKIKEQMNQMPYTDKRGRIYKYGEFFPAELSPFGYNETIAREFFPLTKEQALKQGYSWYDKPKSEHKLTIKAHDLPDHIKDVDQSILKEVIECQNEPNCDGPGAFKIIPAELKFYQKMNLPLPRLCPDCRHLERIKRRSPLKLWQRKCQCHGKQSHNKLYQNTIEHSHKNKPCLHTFQTTYAPERKEIVYCEKCYLKEVG